MVARESQLVALVDAHGAATGSCTVAEAHTAGRRARGGHRSRLPEAAALALP